MLIGAGIGIPFQQNVLARLLGSAEFFAPLTHSAIPTRAASGTTGTFTRATTSTWTNNDGYMVTGVAGEIGFVGARRIYNLWTTSSVSLANGANKSLTLSAGTYAFSMGAGTGTATFSGTGGATGTLAASASGRVSVNKTITAGTFVVTASVADLADLQVESLTAQTTQTAGEYVSVGVESAPYYHGSMVDGVKCFPTDLSGNPIPAATMLGYQAEGARTNLCLQSNAFTTAPWSATGTPAATQNVVGPDGATSAWTFTDDAAGATESVYQAITLTAAAWTASVFMKKTSGSLTAYPVIFFYPGDGTQVQAATVDTTNGVITDWTSADASTMASGRSVRIVSFNDDFWRVELTKTGTAAVHFFQFFPAGATTATYAGPTISTAAQGSAVFANAQVNLGSFAGSYTATTTAAVTRDADVLTYPSAGNIDGTVGWCYAEVAIPTLSGQTQLIAGASVNSAAMYISSDTKVSIYDNTAERKGAAFTASSSVGKLVTTWGGSESKTAFNGTASAALGFDGDLNYSGNLQIGAYAGASAALPMFGTIRNVRIGQRQLSASELQAITA